MPTNGLIVIPHLSEIASHSLPFVAGNTSVIRESFAESDRDANSRQVDFPGDHARELRLRVHVKLGVDRFQVRAHGVHGDPQVLRHPLGAPAARDQRGDARFGPR